MDKRRQALSLLARRWPSLSGDREPTPGVVCQRGGWAWEGLGDQARKDRGIRTGSWSTLNATLAILGICKAFKSWLEVGKLRF